MTNWVSELCRFVGVTSEYRGFDGQMNQVAPDTQVAVLRAMRLDVVSEADAKAVLHQMRLASEERLLPQELIVTAGHAVEVPVPRAVSWSLEPEDGDQVLESGEGTQAIALPALPIGIHRLHMNGEFNTWVMARPSRALHLSDLIAKPRIWGVLAALYGLTDKNAASLGSYRSLGKYAAAMAEHGADFVGINPIHAMGEVRPEDVISPYSPGHREFLNTWYNIETGPSESELIDYRAALQGRVSALDDGYKAFRVLPEDAPEKRALARFRSSEGPQLRDFAVFEVLTGRFGPDWRDWPADYQEPDRKQVAEFAQDHQQAIAQVEWAQWQADAQLTNAQTSAVTSGMRLGLYLDLAVGPRLGGAETWSKDSALVTGATLGAPPDPLGPSGQSWGLAPQCPLKIRNQGYSGFARLLRKVMRHAGMIRIDHVLGLMRSYWIPEGGVEGTYVSYPVDALLAIVVIESVRNNTIVIGEDLGLVPVGLREKTKAAGIYGLDVLQFMRPENGGFIDTSKTREKTVCSFATHDSPTIAGFFAAEDARLRAQTGGIDSTSFADIRADRQAAAETLGDSQPVQEIHRRLARSNSEIVALQLYDLAERKDQQNLPGTVDEYPNWRLKAPFSVRDIRASDAFSRVDAEMSAQSRSNQYGMEKNNDVQDRSHITH